jgi:hypothetical protein
MADMVYCDFELAALCYEASCAKFVLITSVQRNLGSLCAVCTLTPIPLSFRVEREEIQVVKNPKLICSSYVKLR